MRFLKNFMEIKNNKLVTHNGSFHADDVFACAAFALMFEKRGESFKVERTRDMEIIKNGDYVFDVGGVYDPSENRFDHHQKEGAGERENGIPYSSFGLMWDKFGEEISGSQKAKELLEKKIVEPIDAFDNGLSLVEKKSEITPYLIQHMFIAMHPTWKEDESLGYEMFLKSVNIAKEILSREIIKIKAELEAEEILLEIYKNTTDKRIIVLDRKYPYEEILNRFPEPTYVIFERRDENKFWEAEAVRDDFKSFVNRRNFPKAWSGLSGKELQKVTGVEDAVFCHKGLYMVIAKSKEGVIKLAELGLKS